MERFKGTKGKWELYGVMNKPFLHGLVPPDYYQIRYNGKVIADKIEDRADAKLLLASKKMLKSLINLIKKTEAVMLMAGYKQQDIDGYLYQYKELIEEATTI